MDEETVRKSAMDYNANLPGPAWKVIKSGRVIVKTPFMIREFDEDDGWVERTIQGGYYHFRVLGANGWKPRQLYVQNVWVDVAGACKELEELLAALDPAV